MDKKIIIPLDGMTCVSAIELIEKIQAAEDDCGETLIWGFKVNDLLIDQGLGIITTIKAYGFNVFADPKLFDIPNTMTNSINKLIAAGADIITVHCASNYYTEGDLNSQVIKDHLAGVTVLTSFDTDICKASFGAGINFTVLRFALRAQWYSYKYIVCSPQELELVGGIKCLKICPGIRPESYQVVDDQNRVSTPKGAIQAGADLLVIGRPILKAPDPIMAIHMINKEIEEA